MTDLKICPPSVRPTSSGEGDGHHSRTLGRSPRRPRAAGPAQKPLDVTGSAEMHDSVWSSPLKPSVPKSGALAAVAEISPSPAPARRPWSPPARPTALDPVGVERRHPDPIAGRGGLPPPPLQPAGLACDALGDGGGRWGTAGGDWRRPAGLPRCGAAPPHVRLSESLCLCANNCARCIQAN